MQQTCDARLPLAVPAVASAVRLDDAGRIAGRVAHDFDNILMGVMGFAELAQTRLDADSQAAKHIAELLNVAVGAMEITRQLHQFNHSNRKDVRPTRLHDVCRPEVLAELIEAGDGVQFDVDVTVDLPPVAVGLEPIRLVLRNLLKNALETTPAGGRIGVSARTFDGSPMPMAEVIPVPLTDGTFIEISVVDSGPGISSDLLSRIGREPFITTKPRHRGLGIPSVVRTLQAHGGGLRFQNLSTGVAVIAYLPVAELPSTAGRNVARTTQLEVTPS